jgi:hypothetical protein
VFDERRLVGLLFLVADLVKTDFCLDLFAELVRDCQPDEQGGFEP